MDDHHFRKLDKLDGIYDIPFPLGFPLFDGDVPLSGKEYQKIVEIDSALIDADLNIEECQRRVNTFKSYVIDVLVRNDGIEQLATLRQVGVI